MGYITELRRYVGHKPLIMVSACVLIVNEKKQLLLQKRTDNGYWGYPGGAMELRESLEECAKREVFGETGLTCLELTYFTSNSGGKMHYIYPNGDEVYIVETVFICNKYEGKLIEQKEEALEQRFFDLDNLPNNISPLNKEVIKKFIEKVVV